MLEKLYHRSAKIILHQKSGFNKKILDYDQKKKSMLTNPDQISVTKQKKMFTVI